MEASGKGGVQTEGSKALQRPDEGDLRVNLLGRFEVRYGEQVIIDNSWSRSKAQALLKLLVLNKGRWLHREQVLDTLWPELDPQAAAANLRKNLHYLRSAFAEKDLTASVVSVTAEMLALSPDAWIDFEAFRNQAHAARATRTDAKLYEQALSLYCGDLLPEELYEAWTESVREELKTLRNELLIELSHLYEVRGQTELAAERLELLLKADPLLEEGHRGLMRLYAQAGNREKASRQYQTCLEVLQRELGVQPSAETEALHRQISAGRLAPAESTSPVDGAYVGREREMEELRQRVEDAVLGRGRLAMLAGEPGIGKTRTAEELATYARLRGARVLWGRCFEGEGAPAYWPWVQIIRTYVAECEPMELKSVMGPGSADIAHVVPQVGDALPDLPQSPGLESEQARFRLFDSIAAFFKNAAARRPVVLVLDDLHSADEPSLLLLQHIGREMRTSRLLIVGAYRDVEVGREHPLTKTLGELGRDHAGCNVTLAGLNEGDVARFVEITAELDPPQALVQTVHRETEGNPLFVKEVVRLLESEGKLERPEDVKSWRVAIPQGVREVIGRRLDRLSEECNRVLTAASVIGRDFGLNILERLPGLGDGRTLDLLDEAFKAQVVAQAAGALGAYRFSHALVRETLYDALTASERARLHRQVGKAMERALGADLENRLSELAHHFFQAAPAGEAEKAVDYAQRAGDRALAILAYEEAARLYEMALQALDLKGEPHEALRCKLLLALGEAQIRAGDSPVAKDTFLRAAQIARTSGMAEQLARAALGFGGRFTWGGSFAGDEELSGLLKEALSVLPEEDSILRVKVLARLAGMLSFGVPSERRAPLSSEAVERARRLNDPAALAYALDARFWAGYDPANVDERLALANELVEVAERAGDRERAHQGHHNRMLVLLELGDIEASDRDLMAQIHLANELRQPSQAMYTEVSQGMRALLDGRFDDGERWAQNAFASGQQAEKETASGNFAAQMFAVRSLRGQLSDADAAAAKALIDQYRDTTAPALFAALSFIYSELGRELEAQAPFEHLAANEFTGLPRDAQWPIGMALLSLTCAFLHDAGRAAVLYELLSPFAFRSIFAPPTTCVGSASRYLGLLASTMGRYKEASRHFEDALEMNERMGARPWVAYTEHDYAKMLLARGEPGDREKAQALLTRALETARELGMKKLEVDAEAIMPAAPVPAGAFRTVLFTDLEGSTALTERLGDARAREVLREHERITREALKAHGGTEVKTLGDGFMASFGSATQALECAIAIQKAIAAHSESADVPLRVRIGLNAGEPVAEQEDLYGSAVNMAARIAAQAKGGEVLVSDVVHQLVAGKGFAFADRGEVELKGFADSVRLHEVRWNE